jgi:hypothetical protein
MSDRPEWFAPKRYGIGTGMPIAWQGWLLLVVYLGVVIGAALLLPDRPIEIVTIAVTASILFIFVAMRTTRGGIRWRWGKGD